VTVEALAPVKTPGIAMWLSTEDGVRVFSAGAREDGGMLADFERGERIEFSIELENRLSAARYFLGCTVVRWTAGLEALLFQDRAADIVSYGVKLDSLIGVDHTVSVTRMRAGEPVG
jgi:hypothetical protein